MAVVLNVGCMAIQISLARPALAQVCQDTQVGSHMVRGISGGQRKRVTTGAHPSCPSKESLG